MKLNMVFETQGFILY